MNWVDDPELNRLRGEIIAMPAMDPLRLSYADRLYELGLRGASTTIRNALRNPRSTHTRTIIGRSGGDPINSPDRLQLLYRRGFVDQISGSWDVLRPRLPQMLRFHPARVAIWVNRFAAGYGHYSWTWLRPGRDGNHLQGEEACAWVLGPATGVALVPSRKAYDALGGSLASCLVPVELFAHWPCHPLASIQSLPLAVRSAVRHYDPDSEFNPWPIAAWVYPSVYHAEAAFQAALKTWAYAQPITPTEDEAAHDD